ncbi:hypothetical protein NQZ68_033970, partial [Dissostichus eleginoides]
MSSWQFEDLNTIRVSSSPILHFRVREEEEEEEEMKRNELARLESEDDLTPKMNRPKGERERGRERGR